MKRITFLTGYYGSGKTEVAVNLAIQKSVNLIVDLDVINPYFRSRELHEIIKTHGIQVLSNQLKDGIHADLPYIGGEVFLPFQNSSLRAIYDLGGNDLGAKLLQQFGDYSVNEEIDLLFVLNPFRMETASLSQIKTLITKIEAISQQPVTGIINNTNLLKETTEEDFLEGNQFCKEISEALQIPILYSTCPIRFNHLANLIAGEVIPFHRYFETSWN